MHFEVKKENLLSALNAVIKATTSRGIQPILANILIEAIDTKNLRLLATDLDILIEAIIPAQIEEEGQITLQAKKLLEIISTLSDEKVSFDIDMEKLVAKITSGQAKFDLMGISVEEFPVTNKIEEENEIEIDLEVFLKSIKQTLFSAATFETNNVLSGVFLSIKENIIEVASTDGNRLARKVTSLDKSIDKEVQAIIPIRILNELTKIALPEEEKSLFIGFSQGQVSFRLQHRYLLSRLLEGKYPDYPKLIPASFENVCLANREDLISSMKRTAVMANERTNIVKLDFEKHTLNLSANTPDIGDASDSLEVDFPHDELKIAFNYKFVLEALQAIDTHDVRIEFGGSLAPSLFKPDEEEGYLCLIMPVQVK